MIIQNINHEDMTYKISVVAATKNVVATFAFRLILPDIYS